MHVIPAIDLLEGKCVRLFQGDYAQAEIFSEDPVEMACQWASAGVTRLHLVDLDGAKLGRPANTEAIAAIVQRLHRDFPTIEVQVGGGLRHYSTVSELLSLGVHRVILGTVAIEHPQLVADLCQEFPGQILVGIDARNGLVATRGWLEMSTISAIDLAQQMAQNRVAGIIYTDIQRDGTLEGPNVMALRHLLEAINIPVIASGGMSSVSDLLSLIPLEGDGLEGAIIGRALYTGNIVLKEALQAVGPGRWQDVPPTLGHSAFT